MIKKSELRIGNIYQYRDKSYTNFGQIKNGAEIDEMEDSSFEPVNLSPEILEKAGFINQVDKVSIFERRRLRVYTGLKRSLCYLIEEDTTEAHYIPIVLESLHQLQNLYFALSGEELPIQL